jgi:hypothetical protein
MAAGLPPSLSRATGRPPGTGTANVRVSDDHYGVHVEPSVAVNPRHPRQLIAACQVSPTANPQFIASYFSSDGGATWQSGAVPQLPAAAATTGDDVTVAFDLQGRGYVCATSYAAPRAVYVWRTDDGGRSFSAPVTLLAGQYCDHPWIAAGTGQTLSERNVYAVWAAGTGAALDFTRSTDGGESFEAPRTILADDPTSVASSGPELAAAPHGLVCIACNESTHHNSSGDLVAQVVAVCSTDAGQSFAPPVALGSESVFWNLPGGVIPNAGATVAAAPHGDALCVAFATHQPGAIHSDIMVTASYDGGQTWSEAVAATPADSVTYFQPNLAIDEAGRVAISAFALANGRVDQVLLVSRPRQLRFGPPLRVTTAPFDPHSPTAAGQKHGAWWIGDYQGIATSAGAFHLVWNDTRTGKLDLFAATVRPRTNPNAPRAAEWEHHPRPESYPSASTHPYRQP